MRRRAAALLLGLACPAIAVIYGEDGRRDACREPDAAVRALAASAPALFKAENVDIVGDVARLRLESYAEAGNLCEGEPFRDQLRGASCSAALIGDELVLTAGHCVNTQAHCEGLRVVFGFALAADGSTPSSVPASDVYACVRIEDQTVLPPGIPYDDALDWAILRLDRPVAGRAPLAVDREARPYAGQPVFTIGYPKGLPVKIAGGARVLSAASPRVFRADLDAYDRNSGSPVFDQASRRIIGVLHGGGDDFVSRGGCDVSRRCEGPGCAGEVVSRLAEEPPPEPLRGRERERRDPSGRRRRREAAAEQPLNEATLVGLVDEEER